MSAAIDLSSILAGSPALGGAADATVVAEKMVSLGFASDDRALFSFENGLDRVLNGAESIGEMDDDSAYGYMHVLGAAMRSPLLQKLNPMMVGRTGAVMSRMNSVIQAATARQARETLRPNVIMIFEFDHDAANIAAGGKLSIASKPSLPGVSTAYRDAPLSLRQVTTLLLNGAYASAVMNPKVAQVPMFQFSAPIGVTPPNGVNIQRFAPASYNYGLNPFALRDTDEITLQTELSVDSVATAVVRYQLLWELRAESAFGAGSRCIMPRGASSIRGATAFARN